MTRICIYLTYDEQKIVDKYIGYMLKELKSCVDYLVVVCNETEILYGKEILEEQADRIFFRENIGFDAGGFKDALCEFIGWDNILQYDELVLVNDSIFGPFKSMKMIFTEMGKKEADFWGLTKHGESIDIEHGYFPEHIQSYFFVIRSRLLHSITFKEYWEELPYYETFSDTVLHHEIKFTSYFSNMGYTYCTFANTEVNDSKNIENNYMQYGLISYELIKKRNFPFLKKKQLSCITLDKQTQENFRQAIEYIDYYTDYDVNLIWDNIIRTLDMKYLQQNLHLQYIISDENMYGFYENIVFLVFITYYESSEYVLEYLKEIYKEYSVKIFAEKEQYLEVYQMEGFNCKKIEFSQKLEIYLKAADYDLVCILHDVDITSNDKPSYIGKSCFYNIWENLAKNSNYVSGVIKQFNKEPYLGFLAPPQPNFGQYFGEYGKNHTDICKQLIEEIKKLNLRCKISMIREPLKINNSFWIRGSILKKLGNMKSFQMSFLPYIWEYFIQDAGYYAGIVESINYASMNEVNLQYYLQELTSIIQEQYGKYSNFYELKEKMCNINEKICLLKLLEYCDKYPKILIYGAGEIAKKYIKKIPNINAFIVSDDQKKPDEISGIPVKYLSEISTLNDYGIILCINKKSQMEVINTLEKKGITHYFCT